MTPARPSAGDAIVAEVSIGGRRYRGHGTLVAGDKPVAILTLTPLPARPLFARDDTTDIQEASHA